MKLLVNSINLDFACSCEKCFDNIFLLYKYSWKASEDDDF